MQHSFIVDMQVIELAAQTELLVNVLLDLWRFDSKTGVVRDRLAVPRSDSRLRDETQELFVIYTAVYLHHKGVERLFDPP